MYFPSCICTDYIASSSFTARATATTTAATATATQEVGGVGTQEEVLVGAVGVEVAEVGEISGSQ